MSREMFGPMGNDRYREYVDDIGVSGEHLLGLISGLLDISKIESGEVELAIEQISLQGIVDVVTSMTERALLAKGYQLAVDISENLPDL
jgi:signal transduction histidine kinase